MLASSLISCNYGCNLWQENKILVPLLLLIGGFHFSNLCKSHVTSFVTHV
jgi:hypothetical protein